MKNYFTEVVHLFLETFVFFQNQEHKTTEKSQNDIVVQIKYNMFQWVVLEFSSNLKKCQVFLRQYHSLWERTALSREFGTSQSPLHKGAEPSHFRFSAALGLKVLQKYK